MKKILLLFFASAMLMFYSCQKKTDDGKGGSATTISMDDASAWIDHYMNSKGGGEKFSPFISQDNLAAMMKDAPANSEGVFIMPGTDNDGKNHWLAWHKIPDLGGKTPMTETRAYVSPYDTICRCKPCCFPPPPPPGDMPDSLQH